MSSLSDSLTTNVLALIGIVLGTVFSFFIVYLRYRQEAKKSPTYAEARAVAELQPGSVDNLSNLLVQNFRVLNTYYTENLSQARISSLASISIAIIGFIVIIAGILIAFIGKQELLGAVSSAAGIISEAAAVLFFRQNRVFLDQMQDSLKKLVSTQYLMTSVALSKELDEEARRSEISKINEHLRILMNSLHGLSREEANPP
jgi:hypothetical protein